MENKTKKKGLLDRITSSRVFRVMFSRKIIVVCAILLLIMVLIAIFAPVIAPYSPNKDDLYNVLKGCSAEHWLGTDEVAATSWPGSSTAPGSPCRWPLPPSPLPQWWAACWGPLPVTAAAG